MRGLVALLVICFATLRFCHPAPIKNDDAGTARSVYVVPARFAPLMGNPSHPIPHSTLELRGPLSFIGDWINNSDWFPIEINVPDALSSVGSGLQGLGSNVGGFFQGVGSNINNFSQNVGTNWNNFAQNWGNRFQQFAQNIPVVGNFIQRPVAVAHNTKFGTKYFVLMPDNYVKTINSNKIQEGSSIPNLDLIDQDDLIMGFP